MSIRKDKYNDYIVDISAGINLKTGKRKRIARRDLLSNVKGFSKKKR